MAKNVLLVEGPDDEHVLKHVCGNRGLPKIDEIKPQGGVDRLLENLPVRLKESDLAALGVIIDADIKVASRWDALRTRLVRAGYPNPPTVPDSIGTVILPPANSLLPRAGFWIMPDNTTPGALEDFLQFLIPSGSALFEHVKSSVVSIPEDEKRFTPRMESKAMVHTWLAWQVEPGKPLGTAITARYLDPDVPEVDSLVSWLKRLFFY
ncbi:MAG: DUF3226 domain-containing protein [Candidatus Hydrogenedentes bacterium]|nr:DUF3226 domain-containing protein [Candidatus Hydrogenedentota bacterium]